MINQSKTKKANRNIISCSEEQVKYNKTTLPNGIKIITEEIPTVESFALGICINAGSRDEPKDFPGLAHFLEHSAFRHTKKRSSRQIASQFESLGAYTNAFTTKEITCFYVRALKSHFKKTLELLTDVALNPVFKEKDINKERAIIIEEINSYEDDPEEMIFDYGDKLIFGGHTLGIPIPGTKESVSKISSNETTQYSFILVSSQHQHLSTRYI